MLERLLLLECIGLPEISFSAGTATVPLTKVTAQTSSTVLPDFSPITREIATSMSLAKALKAGSSSVSLTKANCAPDM